MRVGAQGAASAREVADKAEVVLVCVNTTEAGYAVANEVALGSCVQIYIDMSTIGPSVANCIREYFSCTDIKVLDAPVSGSIERAIDATLTIIVSGTKKEAEKVRTVFAAMGVNIFFIGDIPGDGQMMKIANNYLNNVQAIVTSEAIAMGMKFGLDEKIMFDILNVSTGQNSQTSGNLKTP